MSKVGAIFLTCFVVGILVIGFFLTNVSHSEDCQYSYGGIITNQRFSIQRVMAVEVNESFYDLRGFNIREGDNILIGDSLYKEKCSKKMVVYRKDTLNNEYKLVEYHYLIGNCDDCK